MEHEDSNLDSSIYYSLSNIEYSDEAEGRKADYGTENITKLSFAFSIEAGNNSL